MTEFICSCDLQSLYNSCSLVLALQNVDALSQKTGDENDLRDQNHFKAAVKLSVVRGNSPYSYPLRINPNISDIRKEKYSEFVHKESLFYK